MDLQTALVALVALGALAYLGHVVWRTWAASGCGGGCGCGPKPKSQEKLIRADDLLTRVRQGNESGQRGRGEGDDCGKSANFSA